MQLKQKRICVLGAGWLGAELCQHLAHQGALVRGWRSSGKEVVGQRWRISPLRQPFESGLKEALSNTDAVVICWARPKKTQVSGSLWKNYATSMNELKKATQSLGTQAPKHWLYTSSTGIYGKSEGVLTEDDCKIQNSFFRPQDLWQAERLFFEATKISCAHSAHVLRLAGLYDSDRLPGLARMKIALPQPLLLEDYCRTIALVHRKDALKAISFFLFKTGVDIFNIASPTQPTRGELYTRLAIKHKLPLPKAQGVIVPKTRILCTKKAQAQGWKAEQLFFT